MHCVSSYPLPPENVNFPKFEKLEEYELDLSHAFKNFNIHFSEYNQPKIISMFSGFNYGVIVQDSMIALGLDFYLGKNKLENG